MPLIQRNPYTIVVFYLLLGLAGLLFLSYITGCATMQQDAPTLQIDPQGCAFIEYQIAIYSNPPVMFEGPVGCRCILKINGHPMVYLEPVEEETCTTHPLFPEEKADEPQFSF